MDIGTHRHWCGQVSLRAHALQGYQEIIGTSVCQIHRPRWQTSDRLPLLSRLTWGVKQIMWPPTWRDADVPQTRTEWLRQTYGMDANQYGAERAARRSIYSDKKKNRLRHGPRYRDLMWIERCWICDGDSQMRVEADPDLEIDPVNNTRSDEQDAVRDLWFSRNRIDALADRHQCTYNFLMIK